MRVFLIVIAIIGITALIIALIAIIKKPFSVYKNKPEERNPMEGKRVRFGSIKSCVFVPKPLDHY